MTVKELCEKIGVQDYMAKGVYDFVATYDLSQVEEIVQGLTQAENAAAVRRVSHKAIPSRAAKASKRPAASPSVSNRTHPHSHRHQAYSFISAPHFANSIR